MDVRELRAAERFATIEPLSATFAGYEITIVNLSTIGAQVEHGAPIRLGSVGRLIFRRGEVSINVQAFLIWSRLSSAPDARGNRYRSGLRIESGNVEFAIALHTLIKGGAARREPDTLERKRRRLLERMADKKRSVLRMTATSGPDIPPDQMLLVQHARERLLAEPEEAKKWYHRAKYAITHGATTVEIESIRSREEVLAVWEYLERSIDIPTIAQVFEKLRGS